MERGDLLGDLLQAHEQNLEERSKQAAYEERVHKQHAALGLCDAEVVIEPTVPQIQPIAMQIAANSTLNHTTNHTQFQMHLPIFSLFFVQGPTAFMRPP